MECRVRQVIPIEGTISTMLLGDVVYYRLRDDLMEYGRVRTDRLRAVGRLGPDCYMVVDNIITLPPVK
jgi:flavin reductase (DIM6/NTAB) family NADH-FMN oxidoreductase RutF